MEVEEVEVNKTVTLRPRRRLLAADASSATTTTPFSGPSSQYQQPSRHAITMTSTPPAGWYIRSILILTLLLATIILGWAAHYTITKAETVLAETQYELIVRAALIEATRVLHQRALAAHSMATIVAEWQPQARMWPLVRIPGFSRMVQGVLNATSAFDMGLLPIVQPEEAAAFEEHAYRLYNESGYDVTTTGVSPGFGRGIWGRNPANQTRFHDTTGQTAWGSPFQLLTPVLYTDEGAHPILMFNSHSARPQGSAMDTILANCQQQQAATRPSCSSAAMTSIFDIVKFIDYKRPGTLLLQPVYPQQDPTVLVGFVPTPLIFDELLENVFVEKTNGIDCYISNNRNETVVYRIQQGKAVLSSTSTADDKEVVVPHHHRLARSIALTLPASSVAFELTLYPTPEFYHQFRTRNSRYATCGAVAIILGTSLVMWVYDSLVNRAFKSKKELLEARRQFMRYVSHEVRTPLNSVSMGLAVLQAEMAQSMGGKTQASSTTTAILAQDEGSESMVDDYDENTNSVTLRWFQLTKEVNSNVGNAVSVLDDLLNYDKIEQGQLKLDLSLVPLCKIFETVRSEFRLPTERKRLQFQVEYRVQDNIYLTSEELQLGHPSSIPLQLVCDELRLVQVMRNLISNAIKFTPEQGSITVSTLWTEASSDEKITSQFSASDNCDSIDLLGRGKVEIHVTDTGTGMTETQLQTLFHDGVQFNANRLQGGNGSGLGLCIAKGYVEQHGGRLVANSAGLGKGSVFQMTMPVWEAPQIDQKSTQREAELLREAPSSSYPSNSLKILIVDDVRSNRRLLRRLVENRGHVCEEAENGRESVEKVSVAMEEDNPFDAMYVRSHLSLVDSLTHSDIFQIIGLRDAGDEWPNSGQDSAKDWLRCLHHWYHGQRPSS